MPKKKQDRSDDAVSKRLDALIRMYIENLKRTNNAFTDKEAIRILHSTGLTPTEITRIIGRKSRTSVAGELYSKKSK